MKRGDKDLIIRSEYYISHLKEICNKKNVSEDVSNSILAASYIFPFKTNDYIINELINWQAVPDDPIFKIAFPQLGMFHGNDGKAICNAIISKTPNVEMSKKIGSMRQKYLPFSSSKNYVGIPFCKGHQLFGLTNLTPGSLLLSPTPALRCFAYCTYCFRWDRAVVRASAKFSYDDPKAPVEYLLANPDISNVVFSGGDPFSMPTALIKKFVDPLLSIESVRSICLTTRALSWWPYRFTSEKDSPDLLRYLRLVQSKKKHLSIIAHVTHPLELSTNEVLNAIKLLKKSDIIIRCQNPLLKNINDSAEILAELWQREVDLGLIPYYLFIESDCESRQYFKIPFYKVLRIYKDAQAKVSSLAKTVQGPVFMHEAKKILLMDVIDVSGQKLFMFKNIEHPDNLKVGELFFAKFDATAVHIDQLKLVAHIK